MRLNPEFQDEQDWTEADRQAVQKHFLKLRKLHGHGKVRYVGRTLVKNSMAFIVLKVESETEARKVLTDDDAVKAGIMSAEIFPFKTIFN